MTAGAADTASGRAGPARTSPCAARARRQGRMIVTGISTGRPAHKQIAVCSQQERMNVPCMVVPLDAECIREGCPCRIENAPFALGRRRLAPSLLLPRHALPPPRNRCGGHGMGAAARSGHGVAGGAQPAPRLRRAQCYDAGVSSAAATSRRPAATASGRPAGSRGAPKCRPPRIDPNHGTSPPRPAQPYVCRTVPHPPPATRPASVVKNMPSVRTDACRRHRAPHPHHAFRRPRNAGRHRCECLRLAPGRERKNTGAVAIDHGRAYPLVKALRGAGRGAAPWR